MGHHSFKHALKHIILMLAVFLLLSVATMLLWNWLMPAIAGLPRIDFRQATGLFLLARILFGLVAPGMVFHNHKRFHGKWRNMSKEERIEFMGKLHTLYSDFAQTHEKKNE